MHSLLEQYVKVFGAQSGFDMEKKDDKATLQGIYDRFLQPQYLDQIFPKREGGGRDSNPDFVASEMLYLAGVRGPALPTAVAETQQAAVVKEPAKPASRRRRPIPTASSKKSGEPASSTGEKPKVPRFKSTEEADAWVAKL